MNKHRVVYTTVEYYYLGVLQELLALAALWSYLEDIMLSDLSRSQNANIAWFQCL